MSFLIDPFKDPKKKILGSIGKLDEAGLFSASHTYHTTSPARHARPCRATKRILPFRSTQLEARVGLSDLSELVKGLS